MLMPGASPYSLPSALAATGSPALADSPGVSQKDTTFTKIFVGGLPYHTTDKSLREHFEVYGEIEEAVVITDRQSGKSRGYGFVSIACVSRLCACLSACLSAGWVAVSGFSTGRRRSHDDFEFLQVRSL